jgi:hypothetical protein
MGLLNRRIWIPKEISSFFLVVCGEREVSEIVRLLRRQDLGGRWLPEIPEHYSIFAGEVPWCETFLIMG